MSEKAMTMTEYQGHRSRSRPMKTEHLAISYCLGIHIWSQSKTINETCYQIVYDLNKISRSTVKTKFIETEQ